MQPQSPNVCLFRRVQGSPHTGFHPVLFLWESWKSSYSRTLTCSVLSLWRTILTLRLHICHFILITSQGPWPSWPIQTFLLQTFKEPYIQEHVHTCKYLYKYQIYQSSSVAWEFPADRSHTYFPYHYILCLISHTPFINNC